MIPLRSQSWRFTCWAGLSGLAFCSLAGAADVAPDLILHHANVISVDTSFSRHQAIAITGERVTSVGSDAEVLSLAGPHTRVVDLAGKTVLPGLIDSHVHPTAAAMYEYDHAVPTMESIEDVLAYIGSRAKELEPGQWIRVSQVFVTRLRDQRFPSRAELDRVAPEHPVYFRTGPDAALNSLALKLSGIDKDFRLPEGVQGRIERDPVSGEPTGIIRSAGQFINVPASESDPADAKKLERLKILMRDYNSVGITSVSDRNASDDAISLYQTLRDADELTCRVFLYYGVNASNTLEAITEKVRHAAASPLHDYNNRLWLRGVKVFLDGGMLTGSAYMQQPWGVSSIYGIHDADYRGVRYIDPEKLYQISRLVLANDLQMTAHSVGDAAVALLVDTYALIDREDFRVREKRPCVTHCNFMSPAAIQTMADLGIVADLQPAWLWLDGATLRKQFGEERMRWFQPYRTLFEKQVVIGGGSDHMQKIGNLRAVNPYDPFLGMWIVLTRQPRSGAQPLHPVERLDREQALRLYTTNNAWLSFEEHEKGSLEPGKLADMIVVDTDITSCPVDQIRNTRVLATYVGGELVYKRP